MMDNLGLDTTELPLKMFSEAELLLYQNKVDLAFVKLDSISEMFPEHGLTDDILYVKAKLFRKKKEYDQAIAMYTEVMENHKEDVKCDNAIFELAELYEEILEEKEKAMELYQSLFLDYSNSTLAVEARKRFRRLRGDEIQ
jgi:TolA-binding protein